MTDDSSLLIERVRDAIGRFMVDTEEEATNPTSGDLVIARMTSTRWERAGRSLRAKASERGRSSTALDDHLQAFERSCQRHGTLDPKTLRFAEDLAVLLASVRLLPKETPGLERRIWELRRKLLGHDHPETVQSELWLGAMERRVGNLSEAEALIRDAATRSAGAFGDGDERHIRSLTNLAAIRRDLGDLGGARESAEAAIAACERSGQSEGESCLEAKSQLALALSADGFLQRARELQESLVSAYAGRGNVGSSAHEIRALRHLASTLWGLDDPNALLMASQALQRAMQELGAEHSETIALGDLVKAIRKDNRTFD